ncbi:MAG TPA: hypothetical protein PLD55_12165 [bacterium]|nr:hypothetical protein [bacterium]HNZ53939.1 hypothetical protein [bacterium]HOG44043.1 hypothetical protein [bacterium]HQM85424.1 hypothetical protein [bacterium]
MKSFFKLFSFFLAVLFVLSSCDSSTIKTKKNDDNNSDSDEDIENINDSDDIGDTGNTGDSGDSGNTGNTGDSGDTGNSGNSGNTGDTVSETCGDNIVDTGEICDGNVINCVDIDSQLYSGGKSKCLDTCLGWDTATCDEIPHTCGNDITEGPEECDGNIIDCNELDSEKYESGKAKCLDDCSGYDTLTCVEYEPSTCGDEKVEGKEVCDGGLKNCVEIDDGKYSGGKAYCKNDCTGWDEITCDEKPVCSAPYRTVKCAGDDALDQMQTCSEGIWSNRGNCLEPGKYAILEKDAVKTDMTIDLEATPAGTDIALIVDTSGSMSDDISVLKNNISTVKTYDGGSDYSVNVSSASCGSGFRGGICFRENSLPLFVLMSDEAFATSGWIWSVGAETTVQNAVDSMNDINAKIAVIDSSGISKYLETNTNTLAAGTYSYDQAGDPFYYNIPTTGTEINLKIEDAVKRMYDETEMTAGLVFESPVSNTIQSTQFVLSHATVSADPAENIHSKDDLYFYGTLRETMLRYSISLRNTVSTPSQMTFLTLKIKLKWYSITLDTIDFTIVIP